jgi:chromate reductase
MGDPSATITAAEAAAPLRILGFAGSLRQGSYNRALLRACVELQPPDLRIETFDIAEIPLFNEDVERTAIPASVEHFRAAIAAADALLIATPEYNHGVPGVLKNAIDWASRPPRRSAMAGKPVGILGASPGQTGTARAQAQLRQAFVFIDSPAMTQPEVLVFRAAEKFDAEGRLTDEPTRTFLGKYLAALATWARRFPQLP